MLFGEGRSASIKQLITKIKPHRVAATFNSTGSTVGGGTRTFLSPEFPEAVPITYDFRSRIYNGGATAGDTQTLTVYFLIGDTWVEQFTQSLYLSLIHILKKTDMVAITNAEIDTITA